MEPQQAEFSFDEPPRSPDEVLGYLSSGMCQGVRLAITRNRVRMASVVFDGSGPVRVRLHSAFLRAPGDVLKALRTYLKTRRTRAWDVVAGFAQTIGPDRAPPAPRLDARGDVFDLAAIARSVNADFFDGRIRYRIGWARRARRRSKRSRSIRYGSWNPETRTIRINRLLDDSRVPEGFVRYIVYHEMLHALVPTVRHGGGSRHHPAEFQVLERRFPDVAGMRKLARRLLNVL